MPPIQFVQAALATWSAGAKTLTFPTPQLARRGDLLIYVAVSPDLESLGTPADCVLLGQLVDQVSGVGVNFTILGRDVTSNEPANRVVTFGAAPTSPPLGACLCYRGAGAGQSAPVASGFAKFSIATTHLVAPNAYLANYSDIYLALVYSAAQNATFTPQNSLVERVDTNNGPGVNGSFTVADVLIGAPGASGGRESTCSISSTGGAAALVMAAGPLLGSVGRSLPSLPTPGAIGLPTKGV